MTALRLLPCIAPQLEADDEERWIRLGSACDSLDEGATPYGDEAEGGMDMEVEDDGRGGIGGGSNEDDGDDDDGGGNDGKDGISGGTDDRLEKRLDEMDWRGGCEI